MSTAIVTFMTSTYATVSHVDKKYESVKQYVNDKHVPIKEDMDEIKASVQNIEATLLKVLIETERLKTLGEKNGRR
jgi:hypothetical protein